MKNYLALLPAIMIVIASCREQQQQQPAQTPAPATPKALTEKSSELSLVSKRGPDDLVEALYAEIVSKSPELQAVEEKLNSMGGTANDSLDALVSFNIKNNSYYSSATGRAGSIEDSLLKKQIIDIIKKSESAYHNNIAALTDLSKTISQKSVTLNDYHILLKLKKTLPVIEAYQQQHLPGTKPLKNVIAEQDKLIKQVDVASAH